MRIAAALLAIFAADVAYAEMGPGPAASGTAVACYDPATGEIIVSANGVMWWHVESATESLTGDANIIDVGGALFTDNDARYGMTSFGTPLNYVNASFGNVAAPGLPLSDLSLEYGVGLGTPEIPGQVLLCIPEQAPIGLAALGAAGLLIGFRRTIAAVG